MKRWSILLTLVAVLAVALFVVACGSSDEAATTSPSPSEATAAKDIVDTAVEAGSFTTLSRQCPRRPWTLCWPIRKAPSRMC